MSEGKDVGFEPARSAILSRLLKEQAASQPLSEASGKKEALDDKIFVRHEEDGTVLQSQVAVDKEAMKENIWSNEYSSTRQTLTKADTRAEVIKLPEKLPVGMGFEKGGRFFRIVEPRFQHLRDKFGENSVFARPVSFAEFAKLPKWEREGQPIQ